MIKFTEEEIKTAELVKKHIIDSGIKDLKAIFVAGEICMYLENQNQVKKLEDLIDDRVKHLEENCLPLKKRTSTMSLNSAVEYLRGLRKALSIMKGEQMINAIMTDELTQD